MYPVSEAYLEKIDGNSVTTNWYGSIKTTIGMVYSFDLSSIVEGSGKITREICPRDDIEIGTTCSAELDLSLVLPDVDRYELLNGTVTLFFQLKINNSEWETVPVGIFTIAEPPERSQKVVTIHAYDAMLKFNRDFGTVITGNPYTLLTYACNACGVELGTTQSEIANYTNGTVETYTYQDVPIYTYRDLIGYIASYLCCYAYIDVDGKLYLKPYTQTPIREITPSFRFDYKPKDYEAFYTAITAYFAIAEETETIVLRQGGLVYDLGTNPLIQFNANDVRKSVLTNIITKLSGISYTPFTASIPCDPSLMVGDVLNFSGNHAVDGKLSAITKQVIKINGSMELSCVGSDPNLNVMTSLEKQISTASRNNKKDGMFYYDFANADEITIGDGESKKVIFFDYVTTKETHVDFHAEVKCFVETTEIYDDINDSYTEEDGVIYVTYKSGGAEIVEYYPVDTFFDGTHLLHLLWTWWASANIIGEFEVYIRCVGCSVTIAQGAARGYIAGVGLVGDGAWDGAVHVDETFRRLDFSSIRKTFTDTVETAFITPDEGTAGDNFVRINFFTRVFKTIHEELTGKSLHRFSVPYNNDQVEKYNIVAENNVWRNDDQSIDGYVITYNCEVERILQVTSNRTPGSGEVTYLVSFDNGETWYTHTDTFVPYESGYGMVEGILSAITDDEWAEMIEENGTIMIKAILQGNATLTDISIYTAETDNWISVGAEDVDSCDSRYVSTAEDVVALITAGYTFTGVSQTINAGHAAKVTVDSTIFFELVGVRPIDDVEGILTDAQLDLHNWVVNNRNWVYSISYENEVNYLEMVGKANVWEDFCTPVEVEPNTDYILMFKFCCPSGYTRANWEHRRAYIWDSTWVYASGENSLTDSRLLGYSAPWTNGASSVLQDYSVTFNSGNNKRIRIQFGFGDCYDEARVRMVFAGFRLKKVI